MKILLLGEFSSLHKYLKDGLLANGHDVCLVSNGNGWKKIPGADKEFPVQIKSGVFGKIKWYHEYVEFIKNLGNYDVIQFINSGFMPSAVHEKCLSILRKKCKCLSLVAAGLDYAPVKKYLEGFFEYDVYDFDKTGVRLYDSSTVKGRLHIKNANMVVEKSDIIIPNLYQYQVGFIDTGKCWRVIPFPINIDTVEYLPNKVNGKIVIYHGIINELKKGTPFIRKALEKINEEYLEKVEIVMTEKLPFEEYVKIMNSVNILVDQCCGYGYGINACIGMAQGKIVLSGAREETLEAFGISKCPIVHIQPDSDYIYDRVKELINQSERFTELGLEARKYVVDNHNYREVALKYIDAWNSVVK